MRVAVTGVAGMLGQRLLALLDSDARVDSVVGIDVRDPERGARKLDFHRLDITHADLKTVLEGVETVVHLAAAVGPVVDAGVARRVNVDATRRLLDAAAAVSARRFVRASSAAIYGAWANNSVPLSEDAVLRPNPGFVSAVHDAECERLMLEWADGHPGSAIVALRIAPIVGPGVDSLFAAAACGRAPVEIKGADRPIQVVHVDDAARALAVAALGDLHGTYNVAADGWLTGAEALAVTGRSAARPRLSQDQATRTLRALWNAGLGEVRPEIVPYLVHPWVIANDRLRAAGWEPRHTNEEALVLAGDLRAATRHPLPWVAAVAAVVTGVAGATWWLTRRQR
jgi:nucleoside-diphosphate-sugar epimerase